MPTMKTIDRAITKYQDDIALIQNQWVLSNPRFKQIKLGEFQGLDFVEVHEYWTPDNQKGYQVIIRANETNGDIYYKSINVGPETSRNRDWVYFDPTLEY